MKLRYITLTGADGSVKPEDLALLSQKYPFVEWAILFSKKQTGKARYPSNDWVMSLVDVVQEQKKKFNIMSLSAHLCGSWVEDVVGGNFSFLSEPFAKIFDRIQLNMGKDRIVKAFKSDLLFETVSKSNNDIIFGGNYDVVVPEEDIFKNYRIYPLFDASGGRGLATKVWTKPVSGPRIQGYAGGLGPNNIKEELEKIRAIVGDNDIDIWVDMESSLRTKCDNVDKFDLEKCEKVLKICESLVVDRCPELSINFKNIK